MSMNAAKQHATSGHSDHSPVRKNAVYLILAAALAVAVSISTAAVPAIGQAAASDVRRHVETLASDELEGRLTGSEGASLAADYIISQLRSMGAVPVPAQASFRLPFEFTSGVNDTGSSLSLRAEVFEEDLTLQGADALLGLPFSDNGEATGSVVFAGYGITVPEGQDYPYDSYANLDVEGKVVLVLRHSPEDVEREARAILSGYSGLRRKAMRARELGATALLVVTGPRSLNAGKIAQVRFDSAASGGSGILAASISGDVAAKIFEAVPSGSLEQAQEELDSGNPQAAGFDVPGLEVTLSVDIERQTATGYNVAGYLPASNDTTDAEPAKAYVMLGAHYDHLGRGRSGSSLARGDEVGEIHRGADDNASGVAALLNAGATLAGMKRDRAIVLAFWSGEEMGTLGSLAFVKDPPVPMDEVIGYINFDMVGRVVDNTLTVQAVGSSDVWPRLIEQSNVPVGFNLQIQEDPYLPTDSSSFNNAGVPNISMFTGTHEDYHRPADLPEDINYEGLEAVARFGALIGYRLANLSEAPAFVQVARSAGQQMGGGDAARAWTGTIPDFGGEVEGLRLGGVMEGGPADEAGLQQGDVIVEFADQQITNIYDYTYALESVKVDEPVKVVYLRGGERHETVLTPRAR
jgi:hypothetical protein